jgi:3-oxoacyl-[acyl-carrier protein] reductase
MGVLEERANLAGKVAIVVGGAQRSGRMIALDLARSGAHVAVCDNDEPSLGELDGALAEHGTRVLTRVTDALDPDDLEAFFTAFDEVFDHLDILVNNVGGVFQKPFMESTVESRHEDILRNFGYVLRSCKEGVPRMRVSGTGGSIINMTTIEAHRGAPGFSVYAGAKAAVENFSRSLAVELAPERIRVNTIAPEAVGREVGSMPAAAWREPERAEEFMTEGFKMYVPLGIVGEAEDISNCALFLASDLSRYMTGTTLRPDGGTFASSGWLNWSGVDGGFLPMPPPTSLERLFGGA